MSFELRAYYYCMNILNVQNNVVIDRLINNIKNINI